MPWTRNHAEDSTTAINGRDHAVNAFKSAVMLSYECFHPEN